MRLKAISAKPPVTKIKTKHKDVAACQIIDGMIVIDCYKNGEWVNRYANNGLDFKTFDGEEWHKWKFATAFKYHPYWSYSQPDSLKFTDKQSEDLFYDFFAESTICKYDPPGGIVNLAESDIYNEKKDAALRRKEQRIKALMDRVPTLPNDMEEWAHRAFFDSAEYAFGKGGSDRYYCTACGKYHIFKKAKHNEERICKNSGKKIVLKKRQKCIDRSVRAIVIQKVDDDYAAIRYCRVEFYFDGSLGKNISVYEEARIMAPRNGKEKFKIFYGQYRNRDEFSQEWWDKKGCSGFVFNGDTKVYPAEIVEALEGTEYDGFTVQALANANITANYNGIMWANSKFQAEYLLKGRFFRLLKEQSRQCCYGDYYGTLNKRGKTASEVLGINMQRVNRLRQIDGGTVALYWLRYEEKTGDRVSAETLNWLDAKNIYPSEIESLTDRMTIEKAAHYLQKQSEAVKETVKQTITTYKDYLSMAKRLKMNLEAEQIYKPKDLIGAHDELVRRINMNADKAEAIAMGKKFPKCSKVLKTLGMYEWGDGEYIVKVPKNIVDIINEGRALSHCVGSSERYFDRIAQRESYILFLRRASAPDHPYYTLEVEPGGVIRQKRTTGDKQLDDIKDAVDFLRRWQSVIQKRLTEKERALQKEARRLRNEEFKQLRKDGNKIWHGPLSGKLLVDVLKKDLMELEIA